MIKFELVVPVAIAVCSGIAYLTHTHYRVTSVVSEVDRYRSHTDHVIDALARIETRIMGLQQEVDGMRAAIRLVQHDHRLHGRSHNTPPSTPHIYKE